MTARCSTSSGVWRCDRSAGHDGECFTRQRPGTVWIGPAATSATVTVALKIAQRHEAAHDALIQELRRLRGLVADLGAARQLTSMDSHALESDQPMPKAPSRMPQYARSPSGSTIDPSSAAKRQGAP